MLERDLVKVLSKWLQKERKEIKFSASDVNKLPLDREIKNPLAVVAVATDMLTIMHQSMLSPRGGGPGIPRGFVIYPFPVGGE